MHPLCRPLALFIMSRLFRIDIPSDRFQAKASQDLSASKGATNVTCDPPVSHSKLLGHEGLFVRYHLCVLGSGKGPFGMLLFMREDKRLAKLVNRDLVSANCLLLVKASSRTLTTYGLPTLGFNVAMPSSAVVLLLLPYTLPVGSLTNSPYGCLHQPQY